MDRATRNYAYVLAALVIALTFMALYEPAKVRQLNATLAADPQLADYPYRFRVLRVESGTAEMSSPRSSSMPVQHMIGALYPELKGRPADDPDFQRAQQSLASHQARARALVLADPEITAVRWKLDDDWLSRHGVQLLK